MAKFDDDRIPLQLLPPEALIEISKVLAMGAKKYGVNDWRRDTIHNIPMSRTYGNPCDYTKHYSLNANQRS